MVALDMINSRLKDFFPSKRGYPQAQVISGV